MRRNYLQFVRSQWLRRLKELKVEAKAYTAPDPEAVRAPEPVPVEKKHRGITEVLVGLVKRA